MENWKIAFKKSAPIIVSYIIVGMAYGMLMEQAGYSWYCSWIASATVYTGAFQFVLVKLMSSGVSLITVMVLALLLNSRQSFYALTFLPDFNEMKSKKPFMIATLTDETYALNCTLDMQNTEKRHDLMFKCALICWASWFLGSALGGIAGELIPFSLDGLDFCLTALFVTIFIDQWKQAQSKIPALTGVLFGIVALLLFGQSSFMLPALLMVSAFLIFYNSFKLPQNHTGLGSDPAERTTMEKKR